MIKNRPINMRIIIAIGLAMLGALMVFEWVRAGFRLAREAGNR
jgi:hypothetical protein